MTSFSLPGLPSLFILRIPPASCMAEPWANARLGNKVAVTPKAESTEAHRAANVLRVKVEFIYISSFQISLQYLHSGQGNAKLNTSLPAAIATYCLPAIA